MTGIEHAADLPPTFLALLVAALTARGRRRQLQRIELRDALVRALAWQRFNGLRSCRAIAEEMFDYLGDHQGHPIVSLTGWVPSERTLRAALSAGQPIGVDTAHDSADDANHGIETHHTRPAAAGD